MWHWQCIRVVVLCVFHVIYNTNTVAHKKNTQKIKAKDTKLNKKHKTKHRTKQNKKQKNKNKNQLQAYKCHLPSNGFVQFV